MASERSEVPEPAGVLVRQLADPDGDLRRAATRRLFGRARASMHREGEISDALRDVLTAEWDAVGTTRGAVVGPLLHAFAANDTDLLTMELIGIALALEGEDGVTELIALLGSEDFVLRHKAVVGIGLLDRSARWAVPALLRAMQRETQPLIVFNVLTALGRIGGVDALHALESMYASARAISDSDPAMLQALESALASARLAP